MLKRKKRGGRDRKLAGEKEEGEKSPILVLEKKK